MVIPSSPGTSILVPILVPIYQEWGSLVVFFMVDAAVEYPRFDRRLTLEHLPIRKVLAAVTKMMLLTCRKRAADD